jgi:hypothetical protein
MLRMLEQGTAIAAAAALMVLGIATAFGNVIYQARGNLGFRGELAGATVHGNVLLKYGVLWARSVFEPGRRSIVCNGGEPLGGPGSGSDFNWDGTDGDVDGTVGGKYLSCRAA